MFGSVFSTEPNRTVRFGVRFFFTEHRTSKTEHFLFSIYNEDIDTRCLLRVDKSVLRGQGVGADSWRRDISGMVYSSGGVSGR